MKFKIDNILIFKGIAVILFFSSVINYYILRSTFFVEIFSVLLVFYGFIVQKNKANKEIYLALFFSFTILSIYVLTILRSTGGYDDGIAKETYRFFSIAFIFLAFYTVTIPYKELFKFILLLCKLYVFYNIYEFTYLNLINFGHVEGLLFGKGILEYYKNATESQYFLPQTEFIIPFIRPYGLWFQPQKSAFIFPMALIVLYIYDRYFEKVKNKNLWYVVFILSTVIAGAKTALLAILILYAIISLSPPKRRVTFKQFTLYFFTSIFAIGIISYVLLLSNFNQSDTSASAFNKDAKALFKTDAFHLFFGLGFLDDKKLMSLGFAVESFIIRIISQIGVASFLFCLLLSIRVFFNKLTRVMLLIGILGFYMIIHYAIINIYFFIFVICLIIHHQKYAVKYEQV
jgi:hypothetical protein